MTAAATSPGARPMPACCPFEDGRFDAVVCQFGLMFVPDKPAAHTEAHRVRGGRRRLSAWDALQHNPLARVTHGTLAGFFPESPPDFYEVPFCLADRAQLAAWLARAG